MGIRVVSAAAAFVAAAIVAGVVSTPRPASAAPPPASSAFQIVLCKGTSADQCTVADSFTAPANRVAVVESVSALCEANSSDPSVTPRVFAFSLLSTSGGNAGANWFTPAAAATVGTSSLKTISILNPTPVAMSADPATTIELDLNGVIRNGAASCQVTLNGHYEAH